MGKKIKLLLAEDNDINMRYEKRLLEKGGYEVVAVTNGAEALEKYENGEFDIILMDIQMPVMNGMEAIREIRRLERDGRKRVKIAAFSAFVRDEDRDRFIKSGADTFIPKPIVMEELLDKLEEIMTAESDVMSDDVFESAVLEGFAELQGVLDGSLEDIKELVGIFLGEYEYRRQIVENCIREAKYEELVMELHAIKNGLITLRQQHLAEELHTAESMARNREKLPAIEEKMHQIYERVKLFKEITKKNGYR